MKRVILIFSSALLLSVSQSTLTRAQHIVTMRNGSRVEGLVTSLANGVVEISVNQTISKINLIEIESIRFATNDKEITQPPGEKTIIAGAYQVRYKVADRSIIIPPRIDNMTQKKGTVVVEVSINKYGNVIKASPGASGSTTNDEYLLTKARQGAESALFNNVPTAPLEQTGYIIISF